MTALCNVFKTYEVMYLNYVVLAKQTRFVIFYLKSDGCNPDATCELL
jgi:hypothetical protein